MNARRGILLWCMAGASIPAQCGHSFTIQMLHCSFRFAVIRVQRSKLVGGMAAVWT
jgi:hypothetical protein